MPVSDQIICIMDKLYHNPAIILAQGMFLRKVAKAISMISWLPKQRPMNQTFVNCTKIPGKILTPQATAHHHLCFFLPMFLPHHQSPLTTTAFHSTTMICIGIFSSHKTHRISIYKWAPLPSLNSLFSSSPPSSLRFLSCSPVACHLPC